MNQSSLSLTVSRTPFSFWQAMALTSGRDMRVPRRGAQREHECEHTNDVDHATNQYNLNPNNGYVTKLRHYHHGTPQFHTTTQSNQHDGITASHLSKMDAISRHCPTVVLAVHRLCSGVQATSVRDTGWLLRVRFAIVWICRCVPI